jgi:hypothetical protein
METKRGKLHEDISLLTVLKLEVDGITGQQDIGVIHRFLCI